MLALHCWLATLISVQSRELMLRSRLDIGEEIGPGEWRVGVVQRMYLLGLHRQKVPPSSNHTETVSSPFWSMPRSSALKRIIIICCIGSSSALPPFLPSLLPRPPLLSHSRGRHGCQERQWRLKSACQRSSEEALHHPPVS